MRRDWRAMLLVTTICVSMYGQTKQPAASPDELNFFRFMLLNLGEMNVPSAITTYETHLARQFALNDQEVAVIDAAGQGMRSLLTQIRASLETITAGKDILSAADTAAVGQLTIQREQKIAGLANDILNAVRPITATRLREPGHIVAQRPNLALGGH